MPLVRSAHPGTILWSQRHSPPSFREHHTGSSRLLPGAWVSSAATIIVAGNIPVVTRPSLAIYEYAGFPTGEGLAMSTLHRFRVHFGLAFCTSHLPESFSWRS